MEEIYMSLLPKAISYFPYYEYIAVGNGLTNEIPPPPPSVKWY